MLLTENCAILASYLENKRHKRLNRNEYDFINSVFGSPNIKNVIDNNIELIKEKQLTINKIDDLNIRVLKSQNLDKSLKDDLLNYLRNLKNLNSKFYEYGSPMLIGQIFLIFEMILELGRDYELSCFYFVQVDLYTLLNIFGICLMCFMQLEKTHTIPDSIVNKMIRVFSYLNHI